MQLPPPLKVPHGWLFRWVWVEPLEVFGFYHASNHEEDAPHWWNFAYEIVLSLINFKRVTILWLCLNMIGNKKTSINWGLLRFIFYPTQGYSVLCSTNWATKPNNNESNHLIIINGILSSHLFVPIIIFYLTSISFWVLRYLSATIFIKYSPLASASAFQTVVW